MVISIKKYLQQQGIQGDILLYRDNAHRKENMCKYLVDKLNIEESDIVYIYSDGAFALYLARALPNNVIHTYCRVLSHDYGELLDKQKNLIIHYPFYYSEFVDMEVDGIKLNQFNEDIILEYYTKYFSKLYEEVKDYKIDAFCDCGHSCATIAGFYNAAKNNFDLDWQFILGIYNDDKRSNYYHLNAYKDYVKMYNTEKFNSFDIGDTLEEEYPEFGNLYEATRSISAAMSYLKSCPEKTVLIYVGDSYEKEGTKFRNSTKEEYSDAVINSMKAFYLRAEKEQGTDTKVFRKANSKQYC